MNRILCLTLTAFGCLFATISSSAQTSVYAGIDATSYGFSSSFKNSFLYTSGSGQYSQYSSAVGVEGGATYMFSSASRLKAGIDVRGLYTPGTKGGSAGFAALRVAFVPHANPLSPYLQLGGGVISTTSPVLVCVSESF